MLMEAIVEDKKVRLPSFLNSVKQHLHLSVLCHATLLDVTRALADHSDLEVSTYNFGIDSRILIFNYIRDSNSKGLFNE